MERLRSQNKFVHHISESSRFQKMVTMTFGSEKENIMNRYLCIIVSFVVFAIFSGCRTTPPPYSCEVKVIPLESTNGKKKTYFVEAKIKIENNKSRPIISSPHLTVAEEEEGCISVKREGTGICFTALVTRKRGTLELFTTITQTRNNDIVWTENNITAIEE